MVVLGGGKGGVGTSTAAALLAVASARRGVDTLLVEAVHTVSSLPLLFGLPPGLPGLLTRGGAADPGELAVTPHPHLTLLPGGGDAVDLSALGVAERRALVRRASSAYDRHALTLVDAGSRLEEVLGALVPGLERLVVVAAPDRVAVAGGYALVKSVDHRWKDAPVEWLVSRADDETGAACHRLAGEATETFLGRALPLSGVIPEDAGLAEAVASGDPVHELPGESPSLLAADRVVGRWLDRQAEARQGGARVLSLPSR